MKEQNVLEPIEGMPCDVAVKHNRLLVVTKEQPLINPVRSQEVNDPEDIQDGHSTRVHKDHCKYAQYI